MAWLQLRDRASSFADEATGTENGALVELGEGSENDADADTPTTTMGDKLKMAAITFGISIVGTVVLRKLRARRSS